MQHLALFLALLIFPFSHAIPDEGQKDADRADLWAGLHSKKFFESCNGESHRDLLKQYDQFKNQFVEEMANIPPENITKFKTNSSFIEIAKVLFPEQLPKGFPLKGAYLICVDSFNDFRLAANPEDRKLKLQELSDCFGAAYRTERPETLKKWMTCLSSVQ